MNRTFTVRQCDRSSLMPHISVAAFPSRSECISPGHWQGFHSPNWFSGWRDSHTETHTCAHTHTLESISKNTDKYISWHGAGVKICLCFSIFWSYASMSHNRSHTTVQLFLYLLSYFYVDSSAICSVSATKNRFSITLYFHFLMSHYCRCMHQ